MFWEALRGLLTNLAVLFTASYLLTRRATPLRLTAFSRRAAAALVVAGLALITMAMPFYIAPGVRIDLRSWLVGFSAWLLGPWIALPAALVVAVWRWYLGGAGMLAGILGALVALGIGTLLHGHARTWRTLTLFTLLITGVVMAFSTLIPGKPLWRMPLPAVYCFVVGLATAVFHFHANDLASRVSLAEQLYQELRFKEAVLDVMDTGLAAFDPAGRLALLNAAARRMLRRDPAPLGCSVADLFPGDHGLVAAVHGRQRFEHKLHRLSADGDLYLTMTGLPFGPGLILAFTDVSRLIAMQREEARQRRLSLLGELAAMAAHEIKNPLTTIKGFLQLLHKRPDLGDGARRYVETIAAEAELINRVVTDFLVLGRAQMATPEAVALGSLLGEVAEETRLRFPNACVQVDSSLLVPVLVTDRQALKQVLLNLYANAYDAMGGHGSLYVRAERLGDDLLLELRDTGPGIPADQLSNIFRPFVTTKTDGFGLGLAICERLVQNMHGQIAVASPPGGGAAFQIRLPCTQLLPSA